MSNSSRVSESAASEWVYESWPMKIAAGVMGLASIVTFAIVATNAPGPNGWVGPLVGMGIAAFFYVLGRPRLHVHTSGVTVRNYLRTYRLAWSEVDHAWLPTGSTWARLSLVDESVIGVHALQPARITWLLGRRSKVVGVVDRLNEVIRRNLGN